MRIFAIIYAMAGPVTAGCLVIVALAAGAHDGRVILGAAAAGFALGAPVAWLISQHILWGTGRLAGGPKDGPAPHELASRQGRGGA